MVRQFVGDGYYDQGIWPMLQPGGYRGRYVRDFEDVSPFDPRDFDRPYRSLKPTDFGDRPVDPPPFVAEPADTAFLRQLSLCSRGMKKVGEALAEAEDRDKRRELALHGLMTYSYLKGVLASRGISVPSEIFGDVLVNRPEPARGNSCRDFGDAIDKTIDKYFRGGRGVGADIGDLADKGGACVRDLRDNLGF
jgi:hypothetical protein